MAKPIKRRNIPERRDPGEDEPLPCSPGSVEQQLDMCEDGELRGDEVQHSHGLPKTDSVDMSDEDDLRSNFNVNMAEPDREGDEMSGDEHSFGLQGGEEQEIGGRENIETGIPGDWEEKEPGVTIRRKKTA